MSSGAYNRKKGHDYERQIAKEMRQFFPDAKTSRAGSRAEDPRGIDLIGTRPFNVQCKARQNLNLFETIKEMPEDQNMNIIFWKRNHEKDIVCMTKDDFFKILQKLKTANII